jgi:crotonobetainyl-CoA:carnitine CoA-transferase CaiB-like acyl-CoA transferase
MGGNQKHFEALLEIMDETRVMDDPRFATPAGRLENAELVDETVAGWFARYDRDSLLERLLAAEIPCARLADVTDIVENPQVKYRGQIIEIEHPVQGTVRMQGNPIRLADTPVKNHRTVPTLGQHTDEILSDWLNLDQNAIAALREDGVI